MVQVRETKIGSVLPMMWMSLVCFESEDRKKMKAQRERQSTLRCGVWRA